MPDTQHEKCVSLWETRSLLLPVPTAVIQVIIILKHTIRN
jgi:hypothetical protein